MPIAVKRVALVRVRSIAGQGQYATSAHHSGRLPKKGTFFFGESEKLLGLRGGLGVIAAECM
jgi:hypothetical protein